MYWIPLGHVSGWLSNPDSETFKCPFCEYELYTLYGFGATNECPCCGMKLDFEDKNLQKMAKDLENLKHATKIDASLLYFKTIGKRRTKWK